MMRFSSVDSLLQQTATNGSLIGKSLAFPGTVYGYASLKCRTTVPGISFVIFQTVLVVVNRTTSLPQITLPRSREVKVSFSTANIRSSSNNKLNHVYTSNNYTRNFYFNRISRLWNKLPSIDLSQPLSVIKVNIYIYINTSHFIFQLTILVRIIFVADVNIREKSRCGHCACIY